ncbi:hypothetical protein C5167_043622 [Papaver somniferum]|uniref:F-box domain-containing protein n=2 Tax=Papaver somniferum TaxID=3469 RepID=A0A4Y7LA42_PAPSO|nr:hypothetical protein C5167_043622 [Papaver somniferum]
MVTLRSQTKRTRQIEWENDNPDRISELPEEIITHILSSLPIKRMVSTSVLAKQWRYRWTSVPVIDFHSLGSRYVSEARRPKRINAYMDFVDRVLSFHQDNNSIKKFSLNFDGLFDASRVQGWISNVLIRHKVEELVLIAPIPITFHPFIFTCESLTLLQLHMDCNLHLPESVSFPKLKILRLGVLLENEQFIHMLLSSSPILEELSLRVSFWKIQQLSIFGSNMKRLFIQNAMHKYFDIQINAPNLQSFKYSSMLARDFVSQRFSTLLDAEIIIQRSAGNGETGDQLRCSVTKLFHSVSHVKYIKISEYGLKFLTYQDHFLKSLSPFYNLIHLEVTTAASHFGGGFHDEVILPCWTVETLYKFLHVSPNLESLIFVDGFCDYEAYPSDEWSLDLVPHCLLRHLKSIEFRGCFWNQAEKDLVRLFLKNANVLQTVPGLNKLATTSPPAWIPNSIVTGISYLASDITKLDTAPKVSRVLT